MANYHLLAQSLLLLAFLSVCVFSQTLVKLDTAKYPTALCLDGTPGAFYYRLNNSSKNWVIYHEGGGDMFTMADFAARAGTSLGSSKSWGSTMGFGGMLDSSSVNNPFLYNWNAVYIKYCDGISFLGDGADQVYNGQVLHFRGQAILRAIQATLKAQYNFNVATNVIIAGTSAGGIATYNHVDWWNNKAPVGARVVGVPDAGWFVSASTKKRGSSDWPIFTNASAGVDQSCYAHFNDAGTCFNTDQVYAFITTPLFIVQSRFDEWQGRNFLNLPASCNPPTGCTAAQMDALNNHGAAQYNHMASAGVFTSTKDAVFMDSCFVHGQVLSQSYWNSVKINGETMSAAFQRWFTTKVTVRDVNACDFNCNGSCP